MRYLVAQQYDYAFCTGFNKNMLKIQALSDGDTEKMENDPFQGPLNDKDRAVATFVMKAVKTLDTVEKAVIDQLHDLGVKVGET
jgi:hypothetical protein